MSEKVKFKIHKNIQFPACCVRCLSEENLHYKSLVSGRVVSVRPNIALGLTYHNEIMDIEYPVCEEHSNYSFWQYVYTRRTLGFQLFRGFVYLYGFMSLPLMLFWLIDWLQGKGFDSIGGMKIIFIIAGLSFIFLVKAMITCPIKITSHRTDTMTIKFKNDDYADLFKRENYRFVD